MRVKCVHVRAHVPVCMRVCVFQGESDGSGSICSSLSAGGTDRLPCTLALVVFL